MGTIADLRRRAQRRTDNLYDTLFTRRVSIYLTALLYPLGVSANVVSMLNCVVGACACVLIGLGTGWQVAAGIACVHLFAVLDSVDGELARLHQRFSLLGLFLEDLAAFTMINGMFLAVGWYAHRHGHPVPFVLAIVAVAFGRNAMQVGRRAVLKSIATRRPIDPDALARYRARGPREASLARKLGEKLLHYTNVWIVLTTLIALAQLEIVDHGVVALALCGYVAAVLLKEAALIATYLFTDSLDDQMLAIYDRAGTVPTDPVSGLDLAED